jgi:Protein of unknown function (DUF3515)
VLLFNRSGLREPAGSSPTHPTVTVPAVALPAVPVEPPPSSAAAERACPALISALPTTLAGLAARPVDSPSALVAAWGEPPVLLRCGTARPVGFVGTAGLTVVNGVSWFVQPRVATNIWTAVDRPVYLELTVPAKYVSDPAAVLSPIIVKTLPARAIKPGR